MSDDAPLRFTRRKLLIASAGVATLLIGCDDPEPPGNLVAPETPVPGNLVPPPPQDPPPEPTGPEVPEEPPPPENPPPPPGNLMPPPPPPEGQ